MHIIHKNHFNHKNHSSDYTTMQQAPTILADNEGI